MSFLPAQWRQFFLARPGFALVLGVSLFTALGAELVAATVGSKWLVALFGSQEGVIFWEEFIAGDRVLWWLSFLLVLATPLILRFCERVPWRKLGRSIERNVTVVALISAVFYGSLMHWGAREVAYTPDEACAILQARTFAAFRITPQVEPELMRLVIPKWIQDTFVLFSAGSGRYIPTYSPGYALVMAPFARFGLEWLCNPVLTALSLVALFRLTRRLTHSDEGGAWALLFALAAPQIALGAATYFAMPAHLLFNLLFCSLLVRGTKRAAFGAGLIGGFALVLHNPVPHFSFALPWLVWMAFKRRSHLAPLFLGYALLFLPLFLGWNAYLKTFDAGLYVKAASKVVSLPNLLLLLARAAGLCKLVIWATPGAAGLALLGWAMARRERLLTRASAPETEGNAPGFERDYLWLFGVSALVNFALYLFVIFDQGHGWGFRYMHQSWMVLSILPAYFLVKANSHWKRLAAVFCASGLLVMLPLRTLQLRSFMDFIVSNGPPPAPNAPSITFIDERDQRVVFVQDDPFLRDSHWSLRTQSPARNAAIAQRYLKDARRVQNGKWGERWTGSAFLRPGSPQ